MKARHRIVAVLSPKGGAGKTTIAACVAAELVSRGISVVLVDADPQRALADWHGGADGGRPLGEIPLIVDATEAVADKVRDAASNATVIVDLAGFANRTQVAVLEVADLVLVPCRPSMMDARGALAAAEMAAVVNRDRRRKAQVAVVITGASRTRMTAHIRAELADAGVRVLTAEIGHRAAYVEAAAFGSAPCLMGRAAGQAAAEVAALADEIQHIMRS